MGMLLRRRYDKTELPDEIEAKAKEAEDEQEPSDVEETEAEQVPESQENAEEGTDDLDELTVPQLKERLDAAGIEYKANEKKQDLVEKLKGE